MRKITLPYELICSIIKLVTDQPTLNSLSQVNHTFNEYTTPLLYKHVQLGCSRQLVHFLGPNVSITHKLLTTSVTLTLTSDDFFDLSRLEPQKEPSGRSHCTNVNTLSIEVTETHPHHRLEVKEDEIIDVFANWISLSCPKTGPRSCRFIHPPNQNDDQSARANNFRAILNNHLLQAWTDLEDMYIFPVQDETHFMGVWEISLKLSLQPLSSLRSITMFVDPLFVKLSTDLKETLFFLASCLDRKTKDKKREWQLSTNASEEKIKQWNQNMKKTALDGPLKVKYVKWVDDLDIKGIEAKKLAQLSVD